MLFRSFVAVSALSWSASAFLVVPETHSPVQEHSGLPASHALELQAAHSETFRLLCDDCPFPESATDGVVNWSENTRTSLELNFVANNGNLYVNDAHIFPVTFDTVETVKAVQRRESDGKETEPLRLGFALMALPLAPPQEDMELLQIRFSPLDIDGHPAPLDTVSITAIQTAAGELFILRTELELPAGDDDHASWKQCNGDVQCLRHLIFHRIRALVHSAQAHMMNLKSKLGFGKGCHGKPRPAHRRPSHDGLDFAQLDAEHHPLFNQPAHPHHRHHMHGVRAIFFRAVRFVIVPAILGVFAGLTASAIGMLVGQAIVFLWRRRAHRCSNARRSPSTLETGDASVKAALIVEQEVSREELPPYTDTDYAPQDTK